VTHVPAGDLTPGTVRRMVASKVPPCCALSKLPISSLVVLRAESTKQDAHPAYWKNLAFFLRLWAEIWK